MNTKYVVGLVSTYPLRTAGASSLLRTALVFPEQISHQHVSEKLIVGDPISAGFFYIETDGSIVTYGKSDILDLMPAEGDGELIAKSVGLR